MTDRLVRVAALIVLVQCIGIPSAASAQPSRLAGSVGLNIVADTRPRFLVGLGAGQDPQTAIKALGLQDARIVATTADGTVIQTTTDPKRVDQVAREKNIALSWPSEGDFCLIMTPLTPFRGHDHGRHAGRGPHDHDAPDPPLDWGVTPPTPLIYIDAGR